MDARIVWCSTVNRSRVSSVSPLISSLTRFKVTRCIIGSLWEIIMGFKLQLKKELIMNLWYKLVPAAVGTTNLVSSGKGRVMMKGIFIDRTTERGCGVWNTGSSTRFALLRILYSRHPLELLLFSTYALQPSRVIVRSGLEVPTFAARRLHACHHARAPSGGRWNCGREM